MKQYFTLEDGLIMLVKFYLLKYILVNHRKEKPQEIGLYTSVGEWLQWITPWRIFYLYNLKINEKKSFVFLILLINCNKILRIVHIGNSN